MSDALTFISFLKEISRHTVTGLSLHYVIVKKQSTERNARTLFFTFAERQREKNINFFLKKLYFFITKIDFTSYITT